MSANSVTGTGPGSAEDQYRGLCITSLPRIRGAAGEVVFDHIGENTVVNFPTSGIGSINGLDPDAAGLFILNAGANIVITNGPGSNEITIASLSGPAAPVYLQTFTNASLVSNILTVTHNLNASYNFIQVYDDTDHVVIPAEIQVTDVNNLTVDFSGFTPISGTWRVVVMRGL